MLYLRFAFCLAFGLAGVAMFMMVIMDTLLVDWDVVSEIKTWFTSLFKRDSQRYVHINYAMMNQAKERAYDGQFLAGSQPAPRASVSPLLPPPSPSYL